MATIPSKLALTREDVAELAPLQKAPREKSRQRSKFVTLPYESTLKAAGQLQNAQLAVLIELANQLFKKHQNPVPLSNKALRAAGITHWAKNRALRKLEEAGLVLVSWHGRKCPLVTIRWK
jgi:hypothetical protein